MIRRPMKGEMIDDLSALRFPVYGAPKIDGFRCLLEKRPLTSRLSYFPNKHFHKVLKGVVPTGFILDSESVVGKRRGPGVLGRTSSGLTSEWGKPDWRLWVFDCLNGDDTSVPFEERLAMAEYLVQQIDHPNIRFLPHQLIYDEKQARAYVEHQLRRGFEGAMFRDPKGPYKEGKSTLRQGWLLKHKPFDTAEGRIKGWFEEQKNENEAKREITGKLKRSSAKSGKIGKGSLGGFILADCKTGVEVRVGGGFTKKQREGLWKLIREDSKLLLNKLVRYKKQRIGEKDKPRHPGFVDFVDFRPEFDMTDY